MLKKATIAKTAIVFRMARNSKKTKKNQDGQNGHDDQNAQKRQTGQTGQNWLKKKWPECGNWTGHHRQKSQNGQNAQL